jgi:hypothetical protein
MRTGIFRQNCEFGLPDFQIFLWNSHSNPSGNPIEKLPFSIHIFDLLQLCFRREFQRKMLNLAFINSEIILQLFINELELFMKFFAISFVPRIHKNY